VRIWNYFATLYSAILANNRHRRPECQLPSCPSMPNTARLSPGRKRSLHAEAPESCRLSLVKDPEAMQPLALSHMCLVSSAGFGLDATLSALRSGRSGLAPCHFETVTLPTWTGEIEALDKHQASRRIRGF